MNAFKNERKVAAIEFWLGIILEALQDSASSRQIEWFLLEWDSTVNNVKCIIGFVGGGGVGAGGGLPQPPLSPGDDLFI